MASTAFLSYSEGIEEERGYMCVGFSYILNHSAISAPATGAIDYDNSGSLSDSSFLTNVLRIAWHVTVFTFVNFRYVINHLAISTLIAKWLSTYLKPTIYKHYRWLLCILETCTCIAYRAFSRLKHIFVKIRRSMFRRDTVVLGHIFLHIYHLSLNFFNRDMWIVNNEQDQLAQPEELVARM